MRLPAPFPGSSFLMASSWAANTASAPWLAREVPRQPVDAEERAGRMVGEWARRKEGKMGGSLAVQWLGCHTSTPGSLVTELRSHKLRAVAKKKIF